MTKKIKLEHIPVILLLFLQSGKILQNYFRRVIRRIRELEFRRIILEMCVKEFITCKTKYFEQYH